VPQPALWRLLCYVLAGGAVTVLAVVATVVVVTAMTAGGAEIEPGADWGLVY
jgi:hypothetical protein